MLRYFAYGANIDPARMVQRVPGASVLGPGYLEGFGLEFTIRDREWGGGVLNARPDPEARVWGMVYEGTPEVFAVLDTFQGDASLLQKEQVVVTTAAGPVEAVTYRVEQLANHVRPTDRYLRHVTGAMAAAGLPQEAVESVLDADRFGGGQRGPSIVS